MIPAFADTFYWIALTVPTHAAHARASQFKEDIVTTDEAPREYLTFFCATPEYMRRKGASIMTAILEDLIAQSRESFLDGLDLYRARP